MPVLTRDEKSVIDRNRRAELAKRGYAEVVMRTHYCRPVVETDAHGERIERCERRFAGQSYVCKRDDELEQLLQCGYAFLAGEPEPRTPIVMPQFISSPRDPGAPPEQSELISSAVAEGVAKAIEGVFTKLAAQPGLLQRILGAKSKE